MEGDFDKRTPFEKRRRLLPAAGAVGMVEYWRFWDLFWCRGRLAWRADGFVGDCMGWLVFFLWCWDGYGGTRGVEMLD